MLVILTLALAGATCALADDPPKKPETQKSSQGESSKEPALTDVVRVSTDEALASAAKQEAKKRSSEDKQKDSPDDAVLELRPSPPEAAAGTSAAVSKEKKSPLKDVHGEVAGAAGNREGGKVGASSKSGKTSVYVETDRSNTTPPR
jgi:cobalamin biosynthesis Mg chelatase CobN